MICANPECKSKEMQKGFIKIIRPGEKDIYYCSQRCFNKHKRVKSVFGKLIQEQEGGKKEKESKK